ncbi:hypothetical protein ARMGADRAFT_676482 [Armillaria gallica]|uniref:Uncharacterized protein n=1 Tax=Armillaria gallica TaxID=47427 RepID=A0A2H3CW34_ARMGA|nr:hypothetical protein ARMGADRAFT_676482 [Armillaria gallica]
MYTIMNGPSRRGLATSCWVGVKETLQDPSEKTRKQRMSLLTGQYFDVGHNHQSRRKFYQSRVVFDDTWQRVKSVQELRLRFRVSNFAGLMESGGG